MLHWEDPGRAKKPHAQRTDDMMGACVGGACVRGVRQAKRSARAQKTKIETGVREPWLDCYWSLVCGDGVCAACLVVLIVLRVLRDLAAYLSHPLGVLAFRSRVNQVCCSEVLLLVCWCRWLSHFRVCLLQPHRQSS